MERENENSDKDTEIAIEDLEGVSAGGFGGFYGMNCWGFIGEVITGGKSSGKGSSGTW